MDGGDRGLRGARHRFAIWAFTLRSDRDDTQAALDRADATVQDEAAQLSDEERTAAAVEAKEQAFGERFQQRYRAVRKRFVAEGKQVDELQSDVEQKAKELAASVEEATQAEGAVAGLRSRLEARDDEGELAALARAGPSPHWTRSSTPRRSSKARSGRSAGSRSFAPTARRCSARTTEHAKQRPDRIGRAGRVARRDQPGARAQRRSNRSRSMTFAHAATKSRTNFSLASSLA
jgi:hypothetical protein